MQIFAFNSLLLLVKVRNKIWYKMLDDFDLLISQWTFNEEQVSSVLEYISGLADVDDGGGDSDEADGDDEGLSLRSENQGPGEGLVREGWRIWLGLT